LMFSFAERVHSNARGVKCILQAKTCDEHKMLKRSLNKVMGSI